MCDYLCALSLKATECACESPLAELQFPLDNLLFHGTEGFHGATDVTPTLAVPRALCSITVQLGRVFMQMEASKPSSDKKSTSTGCAVIHDLSEPPPALTPKKDSGQNEKGHPTGHR